MIEKPVGLTLDDSLAIRDAVAKAGVKTVTSFVLRWNPQFLTVRQLIADGVLGDLVYGEADYWHPLKHAYPGYRSFVTKARGRERVRRAAAATRSTSSATSAARSSRSPRSRPPSA